MDKSYRRRWEVYLRGERIGEVLGATQQAACARAIQRFKIDEQTRSQLEVRPYLWPCPDSRNASND